MSNSSDTLSSATSVATILILIISDFKGIPSNFLSFGWKTSHEGNVSPLACSAL